MSDLEHTVKSRDNENKVLKNELKLKQREIQHQSQHIVELKDLLESSVKQSKPTDIRHRMGMC